MNSRALLAVFACASAACGGTIEDVEVSPFTPPPNASQPDQPKVIVGTESVDIPVYVPDHPLVSEQAVLDGCAMWSGVGCFAVDEADSVLQFTIDDAECPKDDKDRFLLGMAGASIPGLDHDIVLYTACMQVDQVTDYATPINVDVLRNVIGHEVGHSLGMIRHVAWSCKPEDADPDNPVFADEQGDICGSALMNPSLDASLTGPTELDMRGFAVRYAGFLYPTDVGVPAPDGADMVACWSSSQ